MFSWSTKGTEDVATSIGFLGDVLLDVFRNVGDSEFLIRSMRIRSMSWI